jgi:hypothetical protein
VRESDIEHYLGLRVKSLGGISYKFTSPGRVGVPDRIVVLPDARLVFVELKATGKKPLAHQLREHARLVALGQRVEVIDSLAGVEGLLE